MRKLLFVFLLIPTSLFAQSGVTLPEGSNTLKALHFRNYPGLGLYSPSAGTMFLGNGTIGFYCTSTSCYVTDPTAATLYATMLSTLSTNSPGVANSVWGVSNRLDFEGATANEYETEIAPTDPTADRLITLPDATGTVFLSSLATNGPDAANAIWGASNALVFEGATANDYETSIVPPNPTLADLTFTLPPDSGTALISSLATNSVDVANSIWGVSNGLALGGATGGDGFETTITLVDPTADQTFTLPNYSGTALISTLATNAPQVADSIWSVQNALYFEGTTADDNETVLIPTDATADRALTLPDLSGTVALQPLITADAVVQFGSTLIADASADDRFDVNGGSGTGAIGILGGTGPSAQGSDYPVIVSGLAYFRPAEDQAFTRGHFLIQSATAGAVTDSAAITTIGLNIGKAIRSEAVSATINNAGCTGGAGCVNTAVDTPNAGPAGQITLAVDVAALGWAVGQPVIYWNSGGTSIAGLTDGNVYWLVSVATTNVTIAATKGGAVIVPTTQGDDATQYLQRLPYGIVSIQ